MKHYTITCSEEQLRLIAEMVEDCTRFLSGQCEMFYTTCKLNNWKQVRERLSELKPFVTPELQPNQSYGWNGGNCPNEYQRKSIAMGYGIYREIQHFFAAQSNADNVYGSPTLTCPEQGGLIKIEEIAPTYKYAVVQNGCEIYFDDKEKADELVSRLTGATLKEMEE